MNKKTRSTKSEKWRLIRISVEIAWTNEKSRFEVVVTSYGRNKNRDDELKNIAGQVLTHNSKKIRWICKHLDLERTMSEFGRQLLKKIRSRNQKKPENQCQNAASENKKPLARNVNLILTKKLGLEWTTNGLENQFQWTTNGLEKNPIQKFEKNSKNQSEIAAC